MINSFLVTLVNSQTQPTNPSSTTGNVLWPSNVQVRTYTGDELLAYNQLFDAETDPLFKFLRAIQLLWVVEESVCADSITQDDPRVTYTREQLVGQFENTPSFDRQQVSRLLQSLSTIPALSYLTGDRLRIYRSALSRLDQLAAIICHFGVRPDA